MFRANSTAGYPGFSLAEKIDYLLVGKLLLHGDVYM
jgi:hypothetical protein